MQSIEILEKLISFPTVSKDSNLDLIEFVEGYLKEHGISSKRVPNKKGTKANLYATIGPMEEGGIILSGHTDVVPVEGQPWDTNPFVLTEKENRLYGRGTCDMKAYAAIALSLIPEMKNLKKPIHLAFSYDEEIGCLGAPGMIAELKENLPKPRAVIVGEPTEMKVVTAHKGIVALTTTVTGHEAHSSQTHRGVSAVMTASKLIQWLEDRAEKLRQSAPKDSGFEPHFTTIHVGVINGGTALNIISRHCEFCWDIRSIPEDDPQQIVQDFEAFCQNQMVPEMQKIAPETGIQTRCFADAPALGHEPESEAVRLAKELTTETTTRKVPYAAEAGQFQQAGFPTVICGPGSIDQAHQPNEYIERDQIEQGEVLLKKLIQFLSE